MVARLALLTLALGVSFPKEVRAHSVSTSHGGLNINDKSIFALIEISAFDILHYAGRSIDDLNHLSPEELRGLARKFAPQIGSELIIRGADGRQIPLTRVCRISDSFQYASVLNPKDINKLLFAISFEYSLTDRPDYLTLQQRFFNTGPMHESQLSLHVKANNLQTGSTHVVLTNRGNAETVKIAWPRPGSMETRITTPPVFSAIMAHMLVGDKDIAMEIDIPLPLLETWMTLKRADADLVTTAECAEIESNVRSLVTGKNPLKVDGRTIAPQIEAIGFLGPDDSQLSTNLTPSKIRGIYITRAAVRLRYALSTAPQKIELNWDLFNNAILEAELTLDAGGKTTQHTLTKYSPKLTWERP